MITHWRNPLLLAIIAIMAISLGSQRGLADNAQAAYRLRPGDTLQIAAPGEPTYSGAFLIGTEGAIVFPEGVVGPVRVAGLTLGEAQSALAKALAEYLKDPLITLSLSKFRVAVAGEVKTPGSYEMTAGETVMEAVTRAGGTLRDPALVRIELKRASGEKLLLEPREFLRNGDVSQNLILQPGDEALVGTGGLGDEYKVSGAVKSPGAYPFWKDAPPRALDALQTAGRWTEEANPRKALLIKKDGRQLPLDLLALDSKPAEAGNLLLEPGDEVFVPRKNLQISVQGGVNNPGEYLIEEGTTFLQAIGKAGGPRNDALLKECAVVRTRPQYARISVDLEKVLRQGDMQANPVVQDGDVLWVAERENKGPKRDGFAIFRDIVGPLLWLAF